MLVLKLLDLSGTLSTLDLIRILEDKVKETVLVHEMEATLSEHDFLALALFFRREALSAELTGLVLDLLVDLLHLHEIFLFFFHGLGIAQFF